MVWFVLSEFKWLRFAAGNRCVQDDGLEEVDVLHEVGGLTVGGGGRPI